MKKLLAMIALLWAGNVSAQITLDKTFTGPTSLIKISPTDYRIVVTEPDSSFSIYTLSYTLEKHITPPKVKGKMPYNFNYVSQSTFNVDSKYEYVAYYLGNTIYVYDEDGKVLLQSSGYTVWVHSTPNGTKLGFGQGVYSLAGTYYSAAIHATNDSINNIQVYPNPTTNELHITGDFIGTILISNANGQQLAVLPYKGDLFINTSQYTVGVYFVNLFTNNGVYTQKVEVQH